MKTILSYTKKETWSSQKNNGNELSILDEFPSEM